MKKILQVGWDDVAGSAKTKKYDCIRIEELNATAFHEALKSDMVTFHAPDGCIYTLKDR